MLKLGRRVGKGLGLRMDGGIGLGLGVYYLVGGLEGFLERGG